MYHTIHPTKRSTRYAYWRPNARGERRATPNQPTSATRCPLWPVRSSALFGGGRRPGVGDRAPLPGRPAAYRLPPTTGTSAAPLRPPALPALVGTMPRRPPAARATERHASGAADSRSDNGAEAIGGRLQALVRHDPRVMCACPRCAPHTYWITSSARRSSDGGIVIPSVLAVLRLMTSSNFVGCSTGRSAGLAPLRILAT